MVKPDGPREPLATSGEEDRVREERKALGALDPMLKPSPSMAVLIDRRTRRSRSDALQRTRRSSGRSAKRASAKPAPLGPVLGRGVGIVVCSVRILGSRVRRNRWRKDEVQRPGRRPRRDLVAAGVRLGEGQPDDLEGRIEGQGDPVFIEGGRHRAAHRLGVVCASGVSSTSGLSGIPKTSIQSGWTLAVRPSAKTER
jgi:hypothetical protein